MGGVLVYDSYAMLEGCEKIKEYWDGKVPPKVQMDILFNKQELKDLSRDFFSEKARERDFSND